MGIGTWLKREFGPERIIAPVPQSAQSLKDQGFRLTADGEIITEGLYYRNGYPCYSWSEETNNKKLAEEARKDAKEAIKAKLRAKAEQSKLEQEAMAELDAETVTTVTVFEPAGKVGTPRYVAYVCPHATLSAGVLILTRNGRLAVPRHYRRLYRAMVEGERIVTSTATDCTDAEVDLSNLTDAAVVRAITKARKTCKVVLL